MLFLEIRKGDAIYGVRADRSRDCMLSGDYRTLRFLRALATESTFLAADHRNSLWFYDKAKVLLYSSLLQNCVSDWLQRM